MIYKFKSAASGDLIMLGPQGDQLLRLLGREPAVKGIIEPTAMPAAIVTLQTAAAAAAAAAAEEVQGSTDDAEAPVRPAVSLRQRLWPMIDMLRRSQAANEPVVWGV